MKATTSQKLQKMLLDARQSPAYWLEGIDIEVGEMLVKSLARMESTKEPRIKDYYMGQRRALFQVQRFVRKAQGEYTLTPYKH